MIRGEKVYLRALEPDDLPLLYEWENNVDNWLVSNTSAPFSKHLLQKFIETSSTDLYVNQQMRLMICEKAASRAVGCIDVFEFEPAHLRAGIGILIEQQLEELVVGHLVHVPSTFMPNPQRPICVATTCPPAERISVVTFPTMVVLYQKSRHGMYYEFFGIIRNRPTMFIFCGTVR